MPKRQGEKMPPINDLELMKVKTEKKEKNFGLLVIEPLIPGYGITLANSLRRVILASIEGSAITSVKINNCTHEFDTVRGVKEDLVELIMNLKSMRVKSNSDDEEVIKLKINGPKIVVAGDFAKNPQVEILKPEYYIAEVEKGGKLLIDATVSRGTGYLPTELREDGKLPLGHIAVDAIFTPIKKINYKVENTRVGQITNYDKITFEITTDGSIDPEIALSNGAKILTEYYSSILNQTKTEEKPDKKTRKKSTKKTTNAKAKNKK